MSANTWRVQGGSGGGGVGSAIGSAIVGSISQAVAGNISARHAERHIRAAGDEERKTILTRADVSERLFKTTSAGGNLGSLSTRDGNMDVVLHKHDNQSTGGADDAKAPSRVVGGGQKLNMGMPKSAPSPRPRPNPTQPPADAAPTAGGPPARRAPMALAEGASTRMATKTLNPKEPQAQPAAAKREALETSSKGPGSFPHPKDVASAVKSKKIGKAAADALHPGWKDIK